MPRPKGSKNQSSKELKSHKVYPVRLEKDLQHFVDSSPNKNALFNLAVRLEMERAIEAGEYTMPEPESVTEKIF